MAQTWSESWLDLWVKCVIFGCSLELSWGGFGLSLTSLRLMAVAAAVHELVSDLRYQFQVSERLVHQAGQRRRDFMSRRASEKSCLWRSGVNAAFCVRSYHRDV